MIESVDRCIDVVAVCSSWVPKVVAGASRRSSFTGVGRIIMEEEAFRDNGRIAASMTATCSFRSHHIVRLTDPFTSRA